MKETLTKTLTLHLKSLKKQLAAVTPEYERTRGHETYAAAKASREVALLKSLVKQTEETLWTLEARF